MFVLGGARSGKSRYAQEYVAGLELPVAYLATATACDDEMTARIKRHQQDRPARWRTVEEPLDAAQKVQECGERGEAVLLECLTLLVSNHLIKPDVTDEQGGADALAEVDRVLVAARASQTPTVLVSNEVGMGLHPMSPLGRLFQDIAGWANQRVAAAADEVYFLVAGIPLKVKG